MKGAGGVVAHMVQDGKGAQCLDFADIARGAGVWGEGGGREG